MRGGNRDIHPPPRSTAGYRGSDLGSAGLLAVVGPELGASVATLGASAEVLIEDLDRLDARTIGCQAAAIRCRALRLQAYVENLLCAATIRQGRFRVQPRPLNLAEAAAEVRAVVGPLLDEKAQRLRLSARGALPNVLADGQRIGQVLVNLVGNAIRFSDPGTPIDVAIAARGDRVRVTVSDRGPGFPVGTAGTLLESSRRVAPAGGDAQRIGLGLPVVKHIVEAHGGRVGAGPRPGGGARVWFELPVTTPPASAPAAGRSPRPRSRRISAPRTR